MNILRFDFALHNIDRTIEVNRGRGALRSRGVEGSTRIRLEVFSKHRCFSAMLLTATSVSLAGLSAQAPLGAYEIKGELSSTCKK